MAKIKKDPGVYMSYNDVRDRLTELNYGIYDLIDLGLFHSYYYAYEAIQTGKLRCDNLNKRSIIIYRDDILDYWRRHREAANEDVNNKMCVNFTISEVDYISSLINQGKKFINQSFNKDDLFRNMVNHLRVTGANVSNQPHLFRR